MMKRNSCITWEILCIIGLLVLAGNVQANTTPILWSETGSPIPLVESTPVYMKSENITTRIRLDRVHEKTEYVLQNNGNESVHLHMLLPFFEARRSGAVPKSVDLNVDNVKHPFNWTDFHWNGSFPDVMGIYQCVAYELNFLPFEERIVRAEYSLKFDSNNGTHNYGYLTMTGRLWNHSIDRAQFNFFIKSDLEILDITGIKGYNKTLEGYYWLVQKTFYNWTPESNFQISWYYRESVDFMGFPNVIFVMCIALILSIRKRNVSHGKFVVQIITNEIVNKDPVK